MLSTHIFTLVYKVVENPDPGISLYRQLCFAYLTVILQACNRKGEREGHAKYKTEDSCMLLAIDSKRGESRTRMSRGATHLYCNFAYTIS